jgi:hypothetical protein
MFRTTIKTRWLRGSALLVAAMAGTATAEPVPCEVATVPGFSFVCWYGESGNYSQLNTELSVLSDDLEHAGLCAPTAASAALDQLLDRTNAISTSWLGINFEPKTRRTRIINVAPQVGWREGVGSNNLDWFLGRGHDIDPKDDGQLDHADWVLFASPQVELFDPYFRENLEDGAAMVLSRSIYDETCAYDWFDHRQCTYTEDTDRRHAQAVNGTMLSDSGMWWTRLWQSHNSGGVSATAVADEQIRHFQRLAIHGVDDHRPNGAYTSFFYKSGDTYSIVMRVHRIATH